MWVIPTYHATQRSTIPTNTYASLPKRKLLESFRKSALKSQNDTTTAVSTTAFSERNVVEPQEMASITSQPDLLQAPLIKTFPFKRLPDQLQMMVLNHALRIHRITPRIDYMFGSKSTMRSLRLVSRKVPRMTRVVYYKVNIVQCIRFRMTPPPLPHIVLDPREPLKYHFQIPSKTARPRIRHLEMELKIVDTLLQHFGPERPAQLAARVWGGALGVLIGPRQGPSARTAWQADFGELRTLRIILWGVFFDVVELRQKLVTDLGHLAINLRTRSFELEVRRVPGGAPMDSYNRNAVYIGNAFRALLGMEQIGTDNDLRVGRSHE